MVPYPKAFLFGGFAFKPCAVILGQAELVLCSQGRVRALAVPRAQSQGMGHGSSKAALVPLP